MLTVKPFATEKVTLTLPTEVLTEYRALAAQRFSTLSEYLQRMVIDHRPSNSDNRVFEGRPATVPAKLSSVPSIAAEIENTPTTKSGYKGVVAYGKKWAAVAYYDNKRHRLGVYATPEDAAKAYDTAMIIKNGGNPGAAVNFQNPTEQARYEEQAREKYFVDKLASGQQLTPEEWKAFEKLPSSAPTPSAVMGVMTSSSTTPAAPVVPYNGPKRLYAIEDEPVVFNDPEPVVPNLDAVVRTLRVGTPMIRPSSPDIEPKDQK